MLVLLPPSETKHSGGALQPVVMEQLPLPSLLPIRERLVTALQELAADEDATARVLKLGAKQRHLVAVNAQIRSAPTMPAVSRYTGVVFDALDVATLTAVERTWLDQHLVIHSALWGPVFAGTLIPEYRFSATTSVPGTGSLRRLWAEPVSSAVLRVEPAFVLDLRSESYRALGPVPAEVGSAYVRVVTDEGATRALNHFNKKAKGELVRTIAQSKPEIRHTQDLFDWSAEHGLVVRTTADPAVVELVVSD